MCGLFSCVEIERMNCDFLWHWKDLVSTPLPVLRRNDILFAFGWNE